MKKFLKDQSGVVIIPAAIALFGILVAGATLDQTVPKVHSAVAKYVVGADHSADPVDANHPLGK